MLSKSQSQAVKEGLSLWVGTVIPSLFPYAFISATLSKLGVTGKISSKADRFTRKLFNTGGACSYAFFISIIAGYPVGAKTVADLKSKGQITDTEAQRASAFCSTASPMFLLSAIGAITFNSTTFGVLLLLSHLLSAVMVGIIFSFYKPNQKPKKSVCSFKTCENVFYESVFSAITSILFVGGVIVLFSVAINILESLGVLTPLVKFMQKVFNNRELGEGFVLGLFECTTGLKRAGGGDICFFSLPVAGFLCGFGGLCIIMQSVSFLKSAKIKTAPFLVAKLIQAVLNFLICIPLSFFLV